MTTPRLYTFLMAAAALLLTASVARADNAYCYNQLDRDTYAGGFSDSDFDSRADVEVDGGKLVLVTDDKKLGDTNNISIRTRQELKVFYLYESAGGSHTLGWFLFDDNVKKYLRSNGWNPTNTTCSNNNDCDQGMKCVNFGTKYCAYPAYKLRDDGAGSGVANNWSYDWFEELYRSPCYWCWPYLLSGSYNYSDGGTYDHIPNYIEHLVNIGGGWIFLLCDDDWHTSTGGGNSPRLPPVNDASSSYNGVPDYDVNGDGQIDDGDRVVELGTFDAGTEMVFFHLMYYGQSMKEAAAGIPFQDDWDYTGSRIIPFFSKRVLNPDYKSSGDSHKDRDIGCGYPGWCGGYQGWLDTATLNRLRNDFGLEMPHEVKRIYVRQDGQMEHMFLGAPSTDPTWWLLGFEDLYNGGDKDYNDIVFLVWRTNGGEVVSDMVADEIPVADRDDTTITKVRIKKSDVIPTPPCSSDPESARIEYYISVSEDAGGDPIWILVEFPPDSPDDVTLDLQDLGYTGSNLRWKAVIISDNHKCQPYIEDVDVGYEALKHGEYVFTSPLPLANVLYRGAVETPHKNWTVTANDRTNRGHFKVFEMYSPQNPDQETMTEIWDAGDILANRNPDDRDIYTNKDGNLLEFNTHTSNWLLTEVLSSADRSKKHNGKPVYDFDGDSDSDDEDARYVINWTRGWEQPKTLQRAWKLGAINSSTAAIVHAPGEPTWLNRAGIDASIKSSYRSWAADPLRADRRTIAVVGAQDGMIHAFDAGDFRWGDNPQTTDIVEQRGYFKYNGSNPDYGNGREHWAFVPESLLNYAKNNYVKDYYPEENPFAMVDGSVSVADIYQNNTWKTAVFVSMGENHPFITALDVTTPLSPKPLWSQDWTDVDFHGTVTAPTASWVDRGSAGTEGKTWMVATTSGLASTPSDVFLYLIDMDDGSTMSNGKVQLNVGGGIRGDKAYGVAGRPVLLDFDNDGYADRIYVADTSGRIWKHEPNRAPGNSCLVASLGQPVYVTPVISLRQDQANGESLVTIYVGTGDRPDANDTPSPPYHFYALADRDAQTECSLAEVLFEESLPPDEKIWADAFVATDRVYLGTSTGDKAHICDEDPSNPGHLYVYDINPGPNGQATELSTPVSAGGSVVAGVMVYDQHLFANTLGGKTKIVGGSSWNNLASINDTNGLREIYWQEVFNDQ